MSLVHVIAYVIVTSPRRIRECFRRSVLSVPLFTTAMSDSQQRREIDAFFNFFATFDLARPVTTIADLADGSALFDVLSIVYVVSNQYFLLDRL